MAYWPRSKISQISCKEKDCIQGSYSEVSIFSDIDKTLPIYYFIPPAYMYKVSKLLTIQDPR